MNTHQHNRIFLHYLVIAAGVFALSACSNVDRQFAEDFFDSLPEAQFDANPVDVPLYMVHATNFKNLIQCNYDYRQLGFRDAVACFSENRISHEQAICFSDEVGEPEGLERELIMCVADAAWATYDCYLNPDSNGICDDLSFRDFEHAQNASCMSLCLESQSEEECASFFDNLGGDCFE